MSNQLDVKGKTINQIMRWYCEDELYVNRKYQRKLVWSLEEKKYFIDSLLHHYPTPSIMLNSVTENNADGTCNHKYEIVDGVQRLDAILSFIMGDFDVEYAEDINGYFDVSTMPVVQRMVECDLIKQHEPKLDINLCLDFADTEIPVIISQQDEAMISDIFCRINSNGKKLSAHDLRQSSVVDNFSELVRRCSVRIRGDYTYNDSINLCDMRKISIGGRGLNNYGIEPEEIFWRYHEIITYENLRRSRDEEIIASLLANILLERTGRVKSELLDKMYDNNSAENQKALSLIETIGKDSIEETFNEVRVAIDNIFKDVNSTFSKYLFSERKKVPGKDDIFQIIFLALYHLYRKGYKIVNNEEIALILKNSIDTIFLKIVHGEKTNNNDIDTMYQSIYALLKSNMWMKIDRETTAIEKEIKQRLSLSDIELAMTEFKIGILKFASGNINYHCIKKIARTLVGMANSPVDQEGYVIIGVANDEESMQNWESTYGKKSIMYGKHFVVGIEEEALRKYHNIDSYVQALKDIFKNEPISEPLKQYVLSNFMVVNFEDVQLLLIKSQKQPTPSTYNGQPCIRNGNSTE